MPHASSNSAAYCSLAVEDEADVAARAAHVEREDRRRCPAASAKNRAADDAAGEAGEEQLRGLRCGLRRRGGSRRSRRAGSSARRRCPLADERARHDRRSSRSTGLTKASAIVVLARSYSRQTGRDLVRDGDRAPGQRSSQRLGRSRCSCSGFRYENRHADGDDRRRRRSRRPRRSRSAVERPLSERSTTRAVMVEPAADPEAVAPADERLRLLPVQVVEPLLVEPADERHVLEAGVGDEDDGRARAAR